MENLTERIFVENYKGLQIYFTALTEYLPIDDIYSEPKDIQEIMQKIDSGECVYFCAKIEACFDGSVYGSDYLGACIYESFEDFYIKYKDDYYSDMRETATEEAFQVLKTLKNDLNKLEL